MSKMSPETKAKIKESKQLWVSHPTGKMEGIPCVTSNCKNNAICERMSHYEQNVSLKNGFKYDCVCSHCYAENSMNFEEGANVHYARNTELLQDQNCPVPVLYSDIARFETHGDWSNLTHAENEVKIALANPSVHFTGWTKRVDLIIKMAKKGIKQPSNLTLKISSPFLNLQGSESTLKYLANMGWSDCSYFTVYSLKFLIDKYGLEYLREHGAEIISCGGRKCRGCMKCYGCHYHQNVAELLKQDVRKAEKLGIPIG